MRRRRARRRRRLADRTGDRLTGTVTLDRPTQVMKRRRLVAQRATWGEALAFAGVENNEAPACEGVHR